MNALTSLLALAVACLAVVVVYELRPQPGARSDPSPAPSQLSSPTPPAPPAQLDASSAPLADTLLARPLFSQTRRLPNAASPVAATAAAATPLPRMTGILIDGPRRSAIFAPPGGNAGGKPTIVAEGGRIGPFTVQTIEPQQVIVIGPEGKRTVRTSFDPTLQPPLPPPPSGLGAPQFPGIAPGIAPGFPQSAGAAR